MLIYGDLILVSVIVCAEINMLTNCLCLFLCETRLRSLIFFFSSGLRKTTDKS